MTIEFRITQLSLSEHDSVSGFDLGDMTIVTSTAVVSSAGRHPSQSMMIFISLSDLMTLVMALIKGRTKVPAEFVGADSSFTLIFDSEPTGQVKISYSGRAIWEGQDVVLARAIERAVSDFEAGFNRPLDPEDGGMEDYLQTAREFRAFCKQLEQLNDGGIEDYGNRHENRGQPTFAV